MGAREMPRRHRADDGDFPGQEQARAHLRQRRRRVALGQAQEVQAGALRGQIRPAAHRADHDAGQRDRRVKAAVFRQLKARHTDGGLRHAGGVLAAGEVERGQAVGEVALHAHRPAQHAAHGRHLPVIGHLPRGAVEEPPDDFSGKRRLRRDFFTAHADVGLGAGLLVAGKVALHVGALRLDGATLQDVSDDGLRAEGDHVLAGGIGGVEGKVQVNVVRLHHRAEVDQLPVAGAGGNDGAKGRLLPQHPSDEPPRLRQVAEGKGGRAVDRRAQHHGRAAAHGGEQARAAMVAGDERRFRRGQRDAVVALGEQPVHPQRPGDADGQLHRADEVLDVAQIRAVFCVDGGLRVQNDGARDGRRAEVIPAFLQRNRGRPCATRKALGQVFQVRLETLFQGIQSPRVFHQKTVQVLTRKMRMAGHA